VISKKIISLGGDVCKSTIRDYVENGSTDKGILEVGAFHLKVEEKTRGPKLEIGSNYYSFGCERKGAGRGP